VHPSPEPLRPRTPSTPAAHLEVRLREVERRLRDRLRSQEALTERVEELEQCVVLLLSAQGDRDLGIDLSDRLRN
jgi:hypothetical protein